MSKDIRSYFQATKTNSNVTTKSTKRRIISSDEDDVKAQSPVKQTKKTKKLVKNSISSDSDSDGKQKKIVSPAAIFGKKSINRQEAVRVSKQLRKKEVEAHNDDDFEATLSQLDTFEIEQKYLTETRSEKDSVDNNREKHDKVNAGDEGNKKTPTKNNDNVKEKKTPEKLKKETSDNRQETEKQKRSNNPSNEGIEHEDVKSKNAKKFSKTQTAVPKIEIELEVSKKKVSPKKTEIPDVYEERMKKKKEHAAMYQQYLHRGGARHPGSKEVPVGADNCLAGLKFLITGILDSLEREEAEELIKKHGGQISHSVSKKLDYIIVGDEAGPTKMAKARSLNIKEISEDDLLEMIRTRPAGQVHDAKQVHTQAKKRTKKSTETEDESTPPAKRGKSNVDQETEKSPSKIHSPRKNEHIEKNVEKPSKRSPDKKGAKETGRTQSPNKKQTMEVKESLADRKMQMNEKEVKIEIEPLKDINENIPTQALVEKYRPKTMKQILGQQGDKSNARKLFAWLKNWHKNQKGPVKPARPSPWAKSDDGAFFKAALLSGAPGIGKTTTVQVVCKELGFDLVEFNASDTRSKRLLKEEVSELLSNTSLKDYFIDTKNKPTTNHVLLMDEVDGMAGNEDRGGLQELINLIKSTEIPIVCVCNDRNNPKMRTLANHTFDLRFQKPRLEQIRGAMKSICFKENIQISTEDLDRLIESTNSDVRQVINHLALFSGKGGAQEKSEKKHVNKDLRLGPWDVVKRVFSAEEHKRMSIHDKSDLFFHDYNIASLFVQENYLSVIPEGPSGQPLGLQLYRILTLCTRLSPLLGQYVWKVQISECKGLKYKGDEFVAVPSKISTFKKNFMQENKLLEKVAASAESLALGDIVEKSIRSSGAWSLLPMQACYSSVIPGTIMSGHISGQINFPSWLGRNSKAGKFDRSIQAITIHTRLATGVSKEAINLDYIKPLRDAIIRPLAVDGIEGVDAAINVMNHYHLLREDLDSLTELSLWPGDRDPMQVVDTKVKTAFTKAYNKNSAAVPYIVSGTSKKKSAQSVPDEGLLVEGEAEEDANSDDNDDNVESDAMIKAKKPTTSKKTESKGKSNDKSEAKSKSTNKSSKRGRGRGRGK